MQNFNNYNQGCGGYMFPTQPTNYYDFVDGLEGAKAYKVMRPNSIMLLMDSNNAICYKKQVNAYGQTISLEAFDLIPHTEEKPKSVDYVTKEEFDKQIAGIMALLNKGE